jgi:hypothetical protein
VSVRADRDTRDGLHFKWLRIGPSQNRAARRAEERENRALLGQRWNKGGAGWRQKAMRLGSQRARQRAREAQP